MPKFEDLSPTIRENLKHRGISEEQLATMDGEDIFREAVEWEGIIGYAGMFWRWADELRKFEGDLS